MTSQVAWTLGKDAGQSSPKEVLVWLVAPNTTMWRSEKEMERNGEERSDDRGITNGDGYRTAHDRKKWRAAWSQCLSEHQQAQEARKEQQRMWCVLRVGDTLEESDKTRYKCVTERRKSVHEEAGAVQGLCEVAPEQRRVGGAYVQETRQQWTTSVYTADFVIGTTESRSFQ